MAQYNLDQGSIQYNFHMSRAPIQMFGGAFANGKTTALVVKALKLARDYPGSNGLLARETYPKLNDTLRKVFMEWCPPNWVKRKPSQEDNTCYLVNDSRVNFRYVAQRGKKSEDGNTTSNLLSATYDWIGVDQVEDPGIAHKDFLDLLGRLRGNTPYRPPSGEEEDESMPPNGPRWLMLTANPTHNWVYKELVKPLLLWKSQGVRSENLIVDERTGLPIIDLFEGSTYTNAKNLGADYIRNLESTYKGQMRERYLMGKWAAFEGLVHPDFDMGVHVLSREVVMAHLESCLNRKVKVKAIEGYDFGLVSPSVYMLGFIDDLGRVFILDGYYKKEFHYTQQPPAVRDIREKYTGLLDFSDPIYADPAIFRRTVIGGFKSTGETIAQLYSGLGLYMVPSTNDILPGIAKVNSYLVGTMNTPHVVTGATPGPLVYITPELEWFIDEINSYWWKRNPHGNMVDEPMDNNDHAMNTLKYMLARLPEASEISIKKEDLPPGWMKWQEREVTRAHWGNR